MVEPQAVSHLLERDARFGHASNTQNRAAYADRPVFRYIVEWKIRYSPQSSGSAQARLLGRESTCVLLIPPVTVALRIRYRLRIQAYLSHFRAMTVVPFPAPESMWNSSAIRRTPEIPNPMRPQVE